MNMTTRVMGFPGRDVTPEARIFLAPIHRRREHAEVRGAGGVRGESVFIKHGDEAAPEAGIGEVLGREPTPELAAMVAENCEQLLAALEDETLQRIAQYKLEGWTTREIAEALGCVRETVERKLKRIRMTWADEVPA